MAKKDGKNSLGLMLIRLNVIEHKIRTLRAWHSSSGPMLRENVDRKRDEMVEALRCQAAAIENEAAL